jgi:hypothetical protein
MDKETKSTKMLTIALIFVLGAVGVLGYWFVWKPQRELRELAQDTCAELEGSIMLQVGSILSKAQSRALRLGFSAPELGDSMREECPALMMGLAEWSKKNAD